MLEAWWSLDHLVSLIPYGVDVGTTQKCIVVDKWDLERYLIDATLIECSCWREELRLGGLIQVVGIIQWLIIGLGKNLLLIVRIRGGQGS